MELKYQRKIHDFIQDQAHLAEQQSAQTPELDKDASQTLSNTNHTMHRETTVSDPPTTMDFKGRPSKRPLIQQEYLKQIKNVHVEELKDSVLQTTAASAQGHHLPPSFHTPSVELVKKHKKKLRMKLQGNIYRKSRYQEANQQDQQVEQEEEDEMPEHLQVAIVRPNEEVLSESSSLDDPPQQTRDILKSAEGHGHGHGHGNG